MKNPVRPAPAPPYSTGGNQRGQRGMKQVNKWEDFSSEDPFFMAAANAPRSKSTPPNRPPAKKQPPPRPPPPKFSQKPSTKSGNMLMNLFSRQPSNSTDQHRSSNTSLRHTKPVLKETSPSSTTGSLINLNSPPSSPSPTSRSGSDGVSVNSFGSDGPNVNFNNHMSQFENGFEDNFDFFGSLSTNASTPESSDPWSSAFPQDPFSPTRVTAAPKLVEKPVQVAVAHKPSVSVKPTIIRAKTSKPSRAPQINPTTTKSIFEDEALDWSPPMPSVPPPPLPLDALKDFDPSPNVPPRPKPRNMDNLKKPYGIALYDYEASHPDDLSFKANDIVFLEREIDADWLFGQVEDRQGMFPSNFVNIMVPLHAEQNIAIALHSFAAESWEDLEFPEGAQIKVTSQVNSDWLFGEYGGKTGQFPATFIDRIPPNLPIRKM